MEQKEGGQALLAVEGDEIIPRDISVNEIEVATRDAFVEIRIECFKEFSSHFPGGLSSLRILAL